MLLTPRTWPCAWQVLLLWLTKRMSGTWAQIGTVLCLDLASFFSQFELLMGSEAERLTLQQWLGLAIAGLAMWVYLRDEVDADGNQIKGAHVADAAECHVTSSVSLSRASFSDGRPRVSFSSRLPSYVASAERQTF